MARANALTAVKRAGSGHLGSSFSAMDVVVHLFEEELTTARLGWDHPDRDVYFSSKGHDVPGLYAVLHSFGVIPTERLLRLRRLGGLDGHPDVRVPGIEANSGSLGMGISKGRGMAWAKRFLGRAGRVVVMIGDGELQEGQNYEALQGAAHQADREPDRDRRPQRAAVRPADRRDPSPRRPRGEARDLRLARRVVRRARPRRAAARRSRRSGVRPTGRRSSSRGRSRAGVCRSWSIRPRSATAAAPTAGTRERPTTRRSRVRSTSSSGGSRERFASLGLGEVELEPVPPLEDVLPAASLEGEPASGAGSPRARPRVSDEYVAEAYGRGARRAGRAASRSLVVLDADLASDCRIRGFELRYPERFIEVGIAEQDMVSMAAGLARQGLLPVVNSFASFLASRANEQIYNAASEEARIVYALPLRGPDPGRARQVAPEPARRVAPRSAAERRGRPPRQRRGDTCCRRVGGCRGRPRALRFGSRSGPRRGGSSCRPTSGSPSAVGRCSPRARTRSCSPTGR